MLRALDAIYERMAPELAGGSSGGGAAHAAAIGTSGLFGPVEERTYRWSDRRSAASYVRLLGTHSNHRMLPEARRRALQDAVAGAIEAHGGTIEISYVTELYLARRPAGAGELPAG